MKFKVGDTVRYIKHAIYHNSTVKENSIWKIIEVDDYSKMYYAKDKNNSRQWFEEEELEKMEYTYEDLKKTSIGTKVTFEKGVALIKIKENFYTNNFWNRSNEDLKDLYGGHYLGKIIKIEEPTYTTVYKAKVEILDEVEKRYLRGIIRPFRDKVQFIRKFIYSSGNASIDIEIEDSNTGWIIELPPFSDNKMYKGMEENKKYTLEELNL